METEGNAVRGKKEEKDNQNRNDPTLEELLRQAITLRSGGWPSIPRNGPEFTGSQGGMSRGIQSLPHDEKLEKSATTGKAGGL